MPKIRVIIKLPNTEQSSKGNQQTDKISQQPENWASIKSYSRDTSTDQKRQMSETISYIIPGNTKNEVHVPFEAKTDHDDNSLQG